MVVTSRLFLFACWLSAAVAFSGQPAKHSNRIRKHSSISSKKATSKTQSSESTGTCSVNKTVTAKSSLKNIFTGLTNDEAAAVTSFLHNQTEFNLTANDDAGTWDNVIVLVELLQPNKSDAIPYLNGEADAPTRYARATLQFQATTEPYIEEYIVGPLPISNSSTAEPLLYPYNSGTNKIRVYDADTTLVTDFLISVSESISDILLNMYNGTYTGASNDTLSCGSSAPYQIHEDGSVTTWNEFETVADTIYGDGSMLYTGLAFETNITGRDSSKWSVTGWYYDGVFYNTTEDFRAAFENQSFEILEPSRDGTWGYTYPDGPTLPYDDLAPPILVQPEGPRFTVNEENYVEWMGFSFFIGFTRDTGLRLFDIKFNGERIIYELGMQEALAHYAGSGPAQSSLAYLDSFYGFGPWSFELIKGYDCPSYANYLNSSIYWREKSQTHVGSICLFELDAGFPIARHTASDYVYSTKNIHLILRTIETLGNYDYMFEYAFFLDGSIHVTVRASGYIEAAFWAKNSDYGFKIHDALSGAMHDHVINYKLDLDINGTDNSLLKIDVVPTTEVYPWSHGEPRNTMKLNKTFILSEDDSKLNWGANAATSYSVVNTDAPNKYGEYRGYRIAPGTASTPHVAIINSSTLSNSVNWASHQLYAVKQKDTEPRSVYAWNALDAAHPLVDFDKFFDGDSLDQEDIVIYFNLGMHHVPDTSDLPNTVYTTAQSSMMIVPQNFFLENPSRKTLQQAQIEYSTDNVTSVNTFGSHAATCEYSMANSLANLSDYSSDIVISKWPYEPNDPYYGQDSFENIE